MIPIHVKLEAFLTIYDIFSGDRSSFNENDRTVDLFNKIRELLESTTDRSTIKEISGFLKKISLSLSEDLRVLAASSIAIAKEKLSSPVLFKNGSIANLNAQIKVVEQRIKSLERGEGNSKPQKRWLNVLLEAKDKLLWHHLTEDEKISTTLKTLNVKDQSVRADFDFSRFIALEEASFLFCRGLTSTHINQLSRTLRKLELNQANVSTIDFSRFAYLEEVLFLNVKGLRAELLSQMASTLKNLRLKTANDFNASTVDFSRFEKLEELSLEVGGLTSDQINQFPRSLKTLELLNGNVSTVDFSRFEELEAISLEVDGLTQEQINQFPSSLKKLKLSKGNVSTVDFSRFEELEEISLQVEDLTSDQINQFPDTLRDLELYQGDVATVDFLRFEKLERLYLIVEGLTKEQINQFPNTLMNLELCQGNVSTVDFSRFKKLERLFLSVEGLTPAQINQFSSGLRCLILNVPLNASTVDFSKIVKVQDVLFYNVKDLTPEQELLCWEYQSNLILKNGEETSLSWGRFGR